MRSLIAELLAKATGPASLSAPAPFGEGIYGERYEPETRRDFVEAYRDRVWVQRCVNYTANAADSVPIKLFTGTRDNPKEIEGDHPLRDLLERPNPRDPALKFVGETVRWAQIVGEWYWEVVPTALGTIAELYQLRSHLVRIEQDKARPGRIQGFTYDPNETGNVIEFGAADAVRGVAEARTVIYGRFANPFDDFYGMAPLRGAKDDVISEYYAVRYDHRFFRNSARPDLILAFKGKLDDRQRKANREAWKEFKGVDNAHKAAVLGGEVAVTELGKSPKDTEYLEGRRLFREGECAALGVPPVLVGILDKATYSNYEQAEKTFWHDTMVPLLDFVASWATWTVCQFFDDVEWIEFDTSGVEALQENEGERTDRLTKQVAGGLTMPNEARKELGRDEVAGGDLLLLPMSLVPYAGDDYVEPEPAPAIAPPGGDPAAIDGIAEPIDGQPALPPGKRGKARRVPGAAASAYVAFRNAAVRQGQIQGRRDVAAVLRRQERDVIAILEGRKAAEIVDELQRRGWGSDAVDLQRAIGKTHLAVTKASGAATGALLGVDVAFTGDNPHVARVLASLANRPKGIASVSGRIKEEVLEEVRTGLAAGLTHQQIANGGVFSVVRSGEKVDEEFKGIRGVYAEFKGWQAERIARSEASVAFNKAGAASFRDVGVQEVDIIDGDEDQDCADANGSRWPLDEYDANPTSHPNCTRIGLPVIE